MLQAVEFSIGKIQIDSFQILFQTDKKSGNQIISSISTQRFFLAINDAK
jgi:hypothetical protein